MHKRIALGILIISILTILIGSIAFADLRNLPPTLQEVKARLLQMTPEELQSLERDAREKWPTLEKKFANRLREAAEMPREVVARINGEDVLVSDLVRHRAFLEKQAAGLIPFNVTDKMVINNVIKEKVRLAEARKRNLFPTPQELDEFIKWQKELLDEALNDTKNPERLAMNKDVWNAYLSGLGVTAEEFWTDIAPREYERDIAIRNLRNHIMKKVPQQGLTPEEYFEKQKMEWERFTEQLVSEAEVTILNPDKFKY